MNNATTHNNISSQAKATPDKQKIVSRKDLNKIFIVATDKQGVICPPNQVFVQPEFEYLLTIGGNLVGNEKEYNKLRKLLEAIGETEFYICENLGATLTDRSAPFETTVNLKDNYEVFQEKVNAFDPPIGWAINHFFVYGKNENWGIYICEYPTINIIGCKNNFSDDFREVFSINENGYAELQEFIRTEFQSYPDLLKEFIKQYRIDYSE